MNSPISIGFLGGCINNQKGLERQEFYYEVFSGLMKENGQPHRFATSIYISFDKMAEKARAFTAKHEADVLFLVIRQFPLMPLHKPFVKYENKHGDVSWALHPAMFGRRRLTWHKHMTEHHTMHEYVHKDKSRFGMRDMNLLAGKLLGLHRWAARFVAQELLKVKDHCDAENIKLLVLSTQRYPTSIMGDMVCRNIAAYLDDACKREGIPYVNIMHLDVEHFADDKVHFSADCHGMIAELLYELYSKETAAEEKINMEI